MCFLLAMQDWNARQKITFKRFWENEREMNRDAVFRTIISLVIDGNEFQFEGEVEGQIIPKNGEKRALDTILSF